MMKVLSFVFLTVIERYFCEVVYAMYSFSRSISVCVQSGNRLGMLIQSTKEVKRVTAGHQCSFKCLVNEGLS